MGIDHILYRVGDKIARRERIKHSVMSHGDTVVNGDRIEFGGEASEFFNLLLHNLPDLMQMSVTRHKLRERVDHGNNRFAKLRFFHSIRTPERSGASHTSAVCTCGAS